MKIVLMSIGTRGDMEPFLAIGEILSANGHQVICAFPEQFRDLAEGSKLEFASLGTKFIEMLDSEVGRTALGGGGSGLSKFLATLKLAQNQNEVNQELVQKQYEIVQSENPDRIVYNGKAIYPIIWGLDHPGQHILICPLPYMHYVRGHTHVAFNSNFGPFNKLTYALADFGVITTVGISAKWLNVTPKPTQKQIKHALASNKAIYTISPALFSRPDHWDENLQVLGFHQSHPSTTWRPDEGLTNFLDKHTNDRILLVTFGSMTNPEPDQKTKCIVEILERNQIPAILNTASGGIIEPDQYDPELIHFVSRIPYDWIFPKIYSVIHHGGSGTTHLTLKSGCATMIIPHIIDQFVWNNIVDQIGAGPKGVKIGKHTTKNLEPKILELVQNTSYKLKAEQIASQMRQENYREEIYHAIVET